MGSKGHDLTLKCRYFILIIPLLIPSIESFPIFKQRRLVEMYHFLHNPSRATLSYENSTWSSTPLVQVVNSLPNAETVVEK
jgi:hypothetical protein